MSLVNFKDLSIEKSKEISTFTFNNQEIIVRRYLSTEDIYDLIMTTLQKSEEEGIYNAYKMDMYFHLNLVYLYTNIAFDLEDRADEPTIYDKLLQSGLLNEVLQRIDKDDYKNYIEWMAQIAKDRLAQQSSLVPLLREIFYELPNNINIISEAIDELQQKIDNPEAKETFTKIEDKITNKIVKIK